MSTYITVIVRKDGRGQTGHRIKTYGGNEQKTDSSGKATIEAGGSEVSIYVNGREVYRGSTYRCSNPLYVDV